MDSVKDVQSKKDEAVELKINGKIIEAIENFCRYLEYFQSDLEAWYALCDCYCEQKMFKEAVFCHEEVLMAFPQNIGVLCKHAYLVLSSGDVATSRKYYCRATELAVDLLEQQTEKHYVERAKEGLTKCILGLENVEKKQSDDKSLKTLIEKLKQKI